MKDMQRQTYSILILVITFFSGLSLFGQEQIDEIIYYESDFEIRKRLVMTEDGLTSQLYKNYNVEKPFWQDDKHLTITEKYKEANKLFFLVYNEKLGQSGAIFTHYDSNISGLHTIDGSVKSMEKLKAHKFAELPIKLYLSNTSKSQLGKLKSMSELTKMDLIEAIAFVHSFDDLCLEYKTAENLNSFAVYLISENLFHLKLYQLGYNPYNLPEEGNYLEKFKGDQDLTALFTSEHIFQLRLN